ncbi:unnamed protein product [Closterium sp. NIES-54]
MTLKSMIAIFDLDFYAILSAMYALSVSASESRTLPGTAPAEALHTFTFDSGTSRCFFRDSTTLTPLPAPVPVRLADPSGGPVVAHSSTVLPCLAVSSGSLSGLHLASFSTNLVSTAALQDAMVTTTTPGGQRVSICTYTRTGRHLATFTRRPGSSLYASAQPLALCLLAGDLAHTALDGEGWRCVGVPDPLPGPAHIHVAVGSGAALGAASGGAESAGAEPGGAGSEGAETGGAEPGVVGTGGAEHGGAKPEGVEPGGAALEGAESRGAEPQGAASSGDSTATGAGGARGAGGAGGTVRPRPYFVPLLQQVLGTPSSTGLTPPLLCPPPDQSQPPLQPTSPVPAPSPYTELSFGLTERRETASLPVSPVRIARRGPCSRPPPILGTHAMAFRPSCVPLRVPLPAPPESSASFCAPVCAPDTRLAWPCCRRTE